MAAELQVSAEMLENRQEAARAYVQKLRDRLNQVYSRGEHDLFLAVLFRIGPFLKEDDGGEGFFSPELLNRLFYIPGLLKSETQL